MSMKFLADNGGLQALIQAIKDQLALFDRNKQNKLVAGRGITINQSTMVISSDGEPNVQADWNMATESSASFIRNKPDIYTKREIDSMFSATITFVRVDELPATGTHGTVYLVPKQGAGTGDIYDEYLWLSASGSVEAHYELIGSTSVDLTNYYTKSQTDNLLGDKVDKESGKGLSTEDFTTAEKTKLSNIEAGAKANVQSDWNQSDNTKDDYIKNKPTLRQPSADGTSGQYLKSNGNGNAPSWETMDTAPTANSTKAVTSGGVKTALDGKQASISITANANIPTDNDTVIMQDNGNTGTTSFLRRKLSTLWEYFKKKPYGEAYLVWGGKNHNANLSPIDANLISEARANRLARYPLQYMKIEDSRDDGVTWTENTSITDSAKHILVTDCAGNASNIRIGGSDANHVADEHCKTRITFTTYGVSSSILYARIEKICLWIATGGTTGNTCTILGRLQSDVEEDNDVWTTLGGPATLGGWGDWNVIQTDFTTYSNQKATQYGQFRLLFECTGRTSGSTNIGLTIQKIRAYGMRCWTGNNSLALYNSFFAIDSSDNATFPANVTASKHITSGGTTNQMVAGNGDLKDIAETCKTAVSLNGGKYGFRIIKIDGADYTYLLVLADVTGVYDGTITNKKYGIQGFIFMQRDGSDTYKSLVGRVTATASYSSSFVYLYTDVVQSDVVKPCVIKKDGRWLLCLSARGNNGSYNATSIIFFGRTYELADEPFTKIRVDSTFTHYYDGGAEIEYIKQASRYPLWASFGGNNTQFVLGDGTLQNSPIPVSKGGTGATTAIGAEYNILNQVANMDNTSLSDDRRFAICNQTKSATNGVFRWYKLSALWTWIKTHFDSSPTSGSGNGITSGGVYSALEEKVNLQPDFTASQIDYSAGNVGKWQKVLRFPEGADLVINMKKTAMGSDSTSTLWFSSSSMGDSYTSLFGNHSVRFVHDGGYVFLVLACRKSTYEPIESYTFQIAHSSVPMSDIVTVTEASPITATPKEPNIVYRAPITTGAVSFNVTNGAGSVAMANHNDFLGNMTSEATNGVTVTMSGATEGQIYRFVFTRNITGGVTFKQSNVAYCTISGDVNAGDTITLTAVSNTADGWLYEQESAGIKSTDGSVNVEYDGGVADLSINIPPDVVRNNEWTSSLGHRVIAIGDGASADTAFNNVAIGKEADASGNSAVCVGGNSEASGYYSSSFGYNAEASAFGAVAIGGNAVANGSGAVAIGGNQQSQATTSAGYSVAIGGRAIAPSDSVAIGHNANGGTGSYGTTIGKDAKSAGSYTCAVGFLAKANNNYAIAVGMKSEANNSESIAVGANAVVCKKEVDANDNVKYRRFQAMNLQSFTVDGEKRKFYKPATAGDVTITFSGGQTATVNVTNGTLFVVNDSYAPDITSIFNGIMIDGRYYDTMDGTISLSMFTVTPISGLNAWAIDIKMPLAYIDTSEVDNAQLLTEILSTYSAEGCAFGNFAKSYGGYALGRGAVTTFPRQTVVGQYNVPSDSDYFQVGYGNNNTQRRNILTIDSSERMVINAGYVGGVQEIDMSQQSGSLSNITKSVYRIRWNDTGTVTLRLSGGVEGQRTTIYAETNDVQIFATSIVIPQGRFADFLYVDGEWRPMVGY